MSSNLTEELAQVERQLAAANERLEEMLACPRPTYTVDGETFKMTEYQEMLDKMIERLRKRRDILCRATSGDGFAGAQVFA